MKTGIIILFLALTVLIACCQKDYLVPLTKGTLYDKSSKEPLSNVKIILENQKETYQTTTNNDGQFSFENISEGEYTLILKLDLASSLYNYLSLDRELIDTFGLVSTDSIYWSNMYATFFGFISGHVKLTGESDNSNIIVHTPDGKLTSTTDASGFYKIYYVLPGSYNLLFSFSSLDGFTETQVSDIIIKGGQTVEINTDLYSKAIYRYYPLDIGNQWQYKTIYWRDSPPPSGTSTYVYYSIEVIGDTLLTNINKKYRLLKKTNLSGEFQEYIYHRIDSSSLQIYEYVYSNIERAVFSIKNKEPYPTTILGQTTKEISEKINIQPFGERGIIYAKEFGLVNSYYWVPYSSTVTTLIYAKIKGQEYM